MNKRKWGYIVITIGLVLILIVIVSGVLKNITYDINYTNKVNSIIVDTLEIEKKWIINKDNILYDLSDSEITKIEQTYICFSPEIRVRKINDGEEYTFTVKTNMTADGLIRNEMEENITEEEYNSLIKKKEGNTIYKTRYQFLYEDNIYAIDIFEGELEGLAYLEIEFTSKEEADNFEAPDWVTKDVTNDIRYKNGFLARYGVPNK